MESAESLVLGSVAALLLLLRLDWLLALQWQWPLQSLWRWVSQLASL